MKKVNSHEQPNAIEPVGNGTYLINYNIEQATPRDEEDNNPGWDYNSVKVDKPDYPSIVSAMIRAKYSIDEEMAIQRQRDNKPSKFFEYSEYCEECKQAAREILEIECDDCGVPEFITATQLKLQLVKQGYSEDTIENHVESIPDEATRTEALIRYQTARNFYRDNALINTVASLLGWSENDTDEFFINAREL